MSHSAGRDREAHATAQANGVVPSSVLDALEDAILLINAEGLVSFANQKAEALFGRSRREFEGIPYTDLFCKGAAESSLIVDALNAASILRDQQATVCDGNGRPFVVELTVTSVPGEAPHVMVAVSPVGRQPVAENRLRALLDILPNIVMRLSRSGALLEVHIPPEMAADVQLYAGTDLNDLFGEEAAFSVCEHVGRVLGTGRPQRFTFERKESGRRRLYEARLSALQDDEVLAVVFDVTTSGSDEEAYQESEQRFSAIFNSMFQFIGLMRPDGTLIEANDTALEFAGVSEEDVVDRPFWETPWWQISEPTKQELREAVSRAAEGEFVRYDVEILGADDQRAIIDFSIQPIFDEEGNVVLLIPEGRDITEQVRVKQALENSRQLLSGIADVTPDGVMALKAVRDDAGEILDFEWLFANPASEKIVGRSAEYLTGRRLLEESPELRGVGLFPAYVRAVETGHAGEHEYYAEIDGEDRHFHSTFSRLGDGIATTIRDVTEERLRADRLLASQLQLSRAQRLASLGSWEWDPQEHTLTWSDELYKIYGLEVGQPVSWDQCLEMVHPDDRPAVEAALADALEQQSFFSFTERIIRCDGEERILSSTGEVVVDEDGYVVMMGVCHDVTSIRRAEEQIRENAERFRRLADQMTDLVTLHDRDGTYLYVSPSAVRILGFEPHEMIGRKPGDFLHPEDWRRFREGSRAGQTMPDEVIARFKTAQNSWVWLEFLTTAITNDRGEVTSYQSSARDVTMRVEAQQEAARSSAVLAQRNRELQDFAYVASHDLQEPLRKIRAFADILGDDHAANLDEEGIFFLKRIQESASRMSTLISDLLAFSRVSTKAKPFEVVDLNTIAADVVSDLEYLIKDAGGQVVVEELPVLEADPTQMRQLIQNLVGNALKFRRKDVQPLVRVKMTSRSPNAVD
ncbi:MAG: PAS domain S-box protein, partial [Rhodothermales bacterium]